MRRILFIVFLFASIASAQIGIQVQNAGTPVGMPTATTWFGGAFKINFVNSGCSWNNGSKRMDCTFSGVTNSGTLTLNHLALGGGTTVVKVDSVCTTDGAGALSGCTSLSSGTAPTACGSATGCFGATAASTAGTQVAGQGYWRLDSSTGYWGGRQVNGASEVFGVVSAANPTAGIARFAGSTQTVTSSALAASDLVNAVAPSTSGNVLTSNGTTWQSTAPAGGGCTATGVTWIETGQSDSGNNATTVASSNVIYLFPVWVACSGNAVSNIGFTVGVADGTNKYDVGLYGPNCAASGSCSLKAHCTGGGTSFASTGLQNCAAASAPVTITTGLYWFAVTGNATTLQLHGANGTNGKWIPLATSQGTATASSAGTLPASITLSATGLSATSTVLPYVVFY